MQKDKILTCLSVPKQKKKFMPILNIIYMAHRTQYANTPAVYICSHVLQSMSSLFLLLEPPPPKPRTLPSTWPHKVGMLYWQIGSLSCQQDIFVLSFVLLSFPPLPDLVQLTRFMLSAAKAARMPCKVHPQNQIPNPLWCNTHRSSNPVKIILGQLPQLLMPFYDKKWMECTL